MDTCAASIVCTEIRKHLQTLEVDSSHHRTRKGTPNGEQEENTHEESELDYRVYVYSGTSLIWTSVGQIKVS